jgi:hypothetical protein
MAMFVLAGCFASSTPYRDALSDPIPKEEILGEWQNDVGETISFLDDGTFTYEATQATSWNRELGFESFPANADGTWLMCSYDLVSGERDELDRCGESNVSAMWLMVRFNLNQGGSSPEDMVFTKEFGFYQFYIYDVDKEIADEELFRRSS